MYCQWPATVPAVATRHNTRANISKTHDTHHRSQARRVHISRVVAAITIVALVVVMVEAVGVAFFGCEQPGPSWAKSAPLTPMLYMQHPLLSAGTWTGSKFKSHHG